MSGILSLITAMSKRNLTDENKINSIIEKLLEYSNIKTYPSLFDQSYNPEIYEEEKEQKKEQENLYDISNKEMKLFSKALLKWGELIDKLEPVSTLILNKIWSNFLLNITDIDNQLKNQSADMNFASILHRYCIAFLNSVYVESQPDKKISKSNPVIDDKVFNDKIKSDLNKPLMNIDDGKKISLFHFIFSCPLWDVYIDLNNESGMTNENGFVLNYYRDLQRFIFNEININENLYKEELKRITTVNTTKKIKLYEFKESANIRMLRKKNIKKIGDLIAVRNENDSGQLKQEAKENIVIKTTDSLTNDSSTFQDKVDFRRLMQETKENEVKNAMATLKISNEDIISKNADMERYVYVIRRNVQENFAPRTVPSATVKAILEKLKKQNQN